MHAARDRRQQGEVEMEYRHLGSSGLRLSALSLGAWVTYGEQVGEDVTYACMKTAFDGGVNFFDNAEAYGHGRAETMMGAVFKRAGWKRSDLVVSTKIFWGGSGPNDRGLSRKHVLEGAHASLHRLQLDYVDLIYCHRPDVHTPIEETVWAMDQLIRQGRALYWGTSEWSAQQIMEAHAIARQRNLIPPQVEQPQYNMFHRERVERELLRLCDQIGLGLTVWSPLASGVLTGKYNERIPPGSRLSLENYGWLREGLASEEGHRRIEKIKQLAHLADEAGATMAQFALAWCLHNPRVSSVIMGASRPAQVAENLEAISVAARFTPELIEQVDAILANRPPAIPDFR
jgi:voltage-dependent potassium channel beta subunit